MTVSSSPGCGAPDCRSWESSHTCHRTPAGVIRSCTRLALVIAHMAVFRPYHLIAEELDLARRGKTRSGINISARRAAATKIRAAQLEPHVASPSTVWEEEGAAIDEANEHMLLPERLRTRRVTMPLATISVPLTSLASTIAANTAATIAANICKESASISLAGLGSEPIESMWPGRAASRGSMKPSQSMQQPTMKKDAWRQASPSHAQSHRAGALPQAARVPALPSRAESHEGGGSHKPRPETAETTADAAERFAELEEEAAKSHVTRLHSARTSSPPPADSWGPPPREQRKRSRPGQSRDRGANAASQLGGSLLSSSCASLASTCSAREFEWEPTDPPSACAGTTASRAIHVWERKAAYRTPTPFDCEPLPFPKHPLGAIGSDGIAMMGIDGIAAEGREEAIAASSPSRSLLTPISPSPASVAAGPRAATASAVQGGPFARSGVSIALSASTLAPLRSSRSLSHLEALRRSPTRRGPPRGPEFRLRKPPVEVQHTRALAALRRSGAPRLANFLRANAQARAHNAAWKTREAEASEQSDDAEADSAPSSPGGAGGEAAATPPSAGNDEDRDGPILRLVGRNVNEREGLPARSRATLRAAAS